MERKTKKELTKIAKQLDIKLNSTDKKRDIINKINKNQIKKVKEYRKFRSNYGGAGSILPYESGIGGAYAQPSFGFGHKVKSKK